MNTRQSALRSVALAVVALALLAAVLPAAAQATPTPTPLPANPSATPTAASLPANAQVTATSTPLPVAAPLPVPVASFEFVGSVEAAGPGTITLNGLTMDTSRAYMTGQAAAVGDVVKAEGIFTDSGQMVAYELKTIDPARSDYQPGELELVGMLMAMTQNRLTIAGLPMDAANAEIGAGVGIGQLVDVHATLDAQGQWIIREIKLASANDSAGEFKITGTISEMGDGYIVVNGQRLDTANAEIEDALAVGALVKVELRFVDGQWVPSAVELANGESHAGSDQHESGSDDSGSGEHNDDGQGDSGSGEHGSDGE